MTRLTTDQIKPGRSYRLMPRYGIMPGWKMIRKVEEIRDGNVVILVLGREVAMPLKDFAALAVEEVKE